MVNEASNVTAISGSAKAIDDLRLQVESISKAVDGIKKSGITEAALLALLVHACPPVPTGQYKQKAKPNARTIKAVIAGMANLQTFVFGDASPKKRA